MTVENTTASATDVSVYNHLARHQVSAEAWELKDLLAALHDWANVFVLEFKLELPEYTIAVDWITRRAYGLYRYGHNGLGLKASITINRHYLRCRCFWEVLGTLLHELIHGWQESHGKPGHGNYHNAEFRTKAASVGLIIDHRGVTQYDPDGAFLRMLRERGVSIPDVPVPVCTRRSSGNSKLKKFTCGCTNVRVADRKFSATCNNCLNPFRPTD